MFTRKKVLNILEDLIDKIKQKRGDRAEILGSVIRGATYCNDGDILTNIPIHTVMERLGKLQESQNIKEDRQRIQIIVRKVPIDIFYYAEAREYPFYRLMLIGDRTFNVIMRKKAKDMGYKLNQHGLFNAKTGARIPGIKTERDIFKKLKFEWHEPADRAKNMGLRPQRR